jgi:hypothetical protein
MSKTKKIAGDYGNGISVAWLPANQAYLVMWNGQRIAGPINREATVNYLANTLQVSK